MFLFYYSSTLADGFWKYQCSVHSVSVYTHNTVFRCRCKWVEDFFAEQNKARIQTGKKKIISELY